MVCFIKRQEDNEVSLHPETAEDEAFRYFALFQETSVVVFFLFCHTMLSLVIPISFFPISPSSRS